MDDNKKNIKYDLLAEKKFIFIIGSPRSGTTWLQTMIGSHPYVSTTVELTLFSAYTSPLIQSWDRESFNLKTKPWVQGLPFIWTEEDFIEFLRDFLQKAYVKVLNKNQQATHILDKHPGYAKHVLDIYKLIPSARVIHIIRDGRDVVTSMIAAKRSVGFGTDKIENCAKIWVQSILSSRKAIDMKSQFLEIRYEHLLENGYDVLNSVFQFCGLEITNDHVKEIYDQHNFDLMKSERISPDKDVLASVGVYRKGKNGSWKEDLTPLQIYIFKKIAGNMMQNLGYNVNDYPRLNLFSAIYVPFMYYMKRFRSRFCDRILKLINQRQG
jgi:hypothetical protein